MLVFIILAHSATILHIFLNLITFENDYFLVRVLLCTWCLFLRGNTPFLCEHIIHKWHSVHPVSTETQGLLTSILTRLKFSGGKKNASLPSSLSVALPSTLTIKSLLIFPPKEGTVFEGGSPLWPPLPWQTNEGCYFLPHPKSLHASILHQWTEVKFCQYSSIFSSIVS